MDLNKYVITRPPVDYSNLFQYHIISVAIWPMCILSVETGCTFLHSIINLVSCRDRVLICPHLGSLYRNWWCNEDVFVCIHPKNSAWIITVCCTVFPCADTTTNLLHTQTYTLTHAHVHTSTHAPAHTKNYSSTRNNMHPANYHHLQHVIQTHFRLQ